MPFRESSPVEERIGLFREHETGARTDRPSSPFPPLCSAACAAPRRSRNGDDKRTDERILSGISPVQNVRDRPGRTGHRDKFGVV
jgi:hypothetical protein